MHRALEEVELDYEALADRSPFDLSGGQQRRVAFAGVLAMDPTVLILDEPVAGLDPQSRNDFLTLIDTLHKKKGITVVMVSHNMNDIARLADRMLVMNQGRIAFLDTPEAVFSHATELRAINLGLPHAQRMANELREMGIPLPVRLYTPETLAAALTELMPARALTDIATATPSQDSSHAPSSDTAETTPSQDSPQGGERA